ncbi:MAG: PhzF family phenazine biosynthesis protein [Rhodospirillaceae bacterium]|jgi:PhzF family phenazine biosynthesis protein|nr:PhzF family phenazine biosynthesis protein [Rhodospirillaceae bacterium]
MDLTLYQLDAFTDRVFGGNPAAVCPLSEWLPDETLQAIAIENNLSETAFYIPQGEDYHLRWFTPGEEVDFCGHATLATAALILMRLEPERDQVRFHTRVGMLDIAREGDLLVMDFPVQPAGPIDEEETAALVAALGLRPLECFGGTRDYLAVLPDEAAVRDFVPDSAKLVGLKRQATIITAPGQEVDFVSRVFAPYFGIPEDPVTGSSHCTLAPYWSKRLGKTEMTARQISRRGGSLVCIDKGERIVLKGKAAFYMEGRISL